MAGDRVLVRGVNWIGDAVMTLPALRAVRKAMPGKLISLLAKPSVSALFENNPHVDEIITYDSRFSGVLGRYSLTRLLRERGFARAILFQNAFDAALLTALAGIPVRIGYNRDGRGFMLTDPVPYSGEDRRMHHMAYFLELLRRSGLPAEPSWPWLFLRIGERLGARARLHGMRRPIVGINPGAAYGGAKKWPAERFGSVARRAVEELGGSVIVFGTEAEKAQSEEILSHAGPFREHVHSMSGKTTLRELAALIAECDVLVTNDSGPMHIAYAVGTPLVAVFGSTDPALTGPPPTAESIVIRKIIDCSPCFERECSKPSMRCMEAVSPEEVFEGVKALIHPGRAVFFDRDGTLCEDANYLSSWNGFKVNPEIESLKLLTGKGFRLVGITNQSGIARGIVEEGFAQSVNAVFLERHGFKGFYYCPHHPDEGCPCRKPEPGMLVRARAEHGIDLRRSFVVGDTEKDMLAAKAAGAKAVLLDTGDADAREQADFVASGLGEAVKWILEQGGD